MDSRVQIWQHFFPADAAYTVLSEHEWFRAISAKPERTSTRERVLLSYSESSDMLPSLDAFTGIMLLGKRGFDTSQLRAEGFRYIRQFAILPCLEDPRWFIPIGDPRLSSATIQLVAPFKATGRALNWGLKTASRAGIPGWYRHQMVIALRNEPELERTLRSALDDECLEMMISTGTPGPTRKPTLVALNSDGVPLAYAKLAISAISEQLMMNEAACLRHLSHHPLVGKRVPRLMVDSNINDTYVTVQSPVRGKSTTVDLSDYHKDFLTCLRKGPPRPAMRSKLLSTVLDQSDHTQVPGIDLREISGQLRELFSDIELPQTIIHGDFAPWNLRYDQSHINAFDWEYAEIDGLPGLDDLHYQLSVGGLIKKWPPPRAAEHLVRLQHRNDDMQGLSPRHVWGLQAVYQLHMLLRYRENGYSPDEPEVKYGVELFNLFLERQHGGVA